MIQNNKEQFVEEEVAVAVAEQEAVAVAAAELLLSPHQIQYDELVTLINKAAEIVQPNWGRNMNLTNKLTGEGISMKDALSATTYAGYSCLSDAINYPSHDSMKPYINFGRITPYSPKRTTPKPLMLLRSSSGIQMKLERLWMSSASFYLARLNRRSGERQLLSETKPELVAEIEQMARKAHNPELIKEAHVCHLYCDGEQTSQKGGELYGARTEFMHKEPMILPRLVFPEEGRYAIVTEENGRQD